MRGRHNITDGKAGMAAAPVGEPELTDADRAVLAQLREQIAERSRIRKTPVQPGNPDPHESKSVRLERNQRQLEQLLDEAIARPAVAWAINQTGIDTAELRQAAAKGRWAHNLTSAVSTIQLHDLQDGQRRRTVARAARAMTEDISDRRDGPGNRWVDALESDVRASLTHTKTSERQVAERMVAWAGDAMRLIPQPAAKAARTILVERAAEKNSAGETRRDRLAHALREAIARAGIDPGPADPRDPLRDVAPAARPRTKAATHPTDGTGDAGPNRVAASDESESAPGRRQIADLAEMAMPATKESAATDPRLFTRLRTLWQGAAESTGSGRTVPAYGGEELPGALRRRYAIHVSTNGRTIELFEAGAKTAAITLNVRSISTVHNDGPVIGDIVLLARDRGWQSLKVAGTAEFKDALWLEASKAGLTVQHEPSSGIRASLEQWDRERPANLVQHGAPGGAKDQRSGRDDALAQAFSAKSAEERLADPRLRNAQLELMIGIRTAEKELKRPIAEMPDVARALTAAIREQLAQGRMFDAPFVKPEPFRRGLVHVSNPRIEADRIPPPRV